MYFTIAGLYILFLLSLVFQSLAVFRTEISSDLVNATSISLLDYYVNTDLALWLKCFDFILLVLLSSYIISWFLICPNKRFFLSIVAAVGSIGLFVQWIPVPIETFSSPHWYFANKYIEGLKVFRIFPVFSLLSPLKSMKILARALWESRRELGLLVVLVTMSSALFGYLIFVLEIAEMETHFRSIPDGFWWGVITLTTVGYGDMFPQTPAGRVVGVICAVVGILVVALPVPIISGNFTKIYDLVGVVEYQRTLKREADYKKEIQGSYNDRLEAKKFLRNEARQ